MERDWLLGLKSRKEYEARVQPVSMWIVLCDWGVVCVTSRMVSPFPAPQAAVAALWAVKGKQSCC